MYLIIPGLFIKHGNQIMDSAKDIHVRSDIYYISYNYTLIGHASELPYLFNTVSLAGYTFSNNETVLSDSIMQYWGNFVKYSNPNGDFIKVNYYVYT